MPIPFRPIARLLTRTLNPAPIVDLSAAQSLICALNQDINTPGVLVTVNHYHAPDFQSWWFVIPISAFLPKHVHWVVSAGWTNSGWLNGFTHWLFPIGAHWLGFTAMPAMPPDPSEVVERAIAVKQTLDFARRASLPVVGMSPEGMDFPGGVLGDLSAGTGRFLYLLSRSCPTILPVGVWKENGTIHLNFGSPYSLSIPASLSSSERDRQVGDTIMCHIAECLPERLRGRYHEAG